MNNKQNEIILDDGKYKFYLENNILKCDRYNEPWRDFCGDKAVHSLFNRILVQTEIINSLKIIVNNM